MVLGITRKELGDFDEAAELYERVARIHETGPGPAEAADLAHNLAGLDYARGRYGPAEAHARRAVTLRRCSPGTTPVDVATDLAVLGATLAAQDKHTEALAQLTRAVDICRAARPPREYELAVALHNLAAVHQSCGHLRQAEEFYRTALTAKERLLGDDHPEVAVVCNNLGTLLLLRRTGEAEAQELFRRALSIAERTLPAGHPVIADIRHNLERPDTEPA